MASPSSADLPSSLTAPHISWILLSIYYSRSAPLQLADRQDVLGLITQAPLEQEEVVLGLLIYLVRCWNGDNPPPVSLDDLCQTLRSSLLSAAVRLDPEISDHLAQIDSLISWLRAQWLTALQAPGPSSYPAFTQWLHSVFDALSKHLVALEEDGIPDATERMIDRRTPLGIAMRRMALAYDGLDKITAIRALENQTRAWCIGADEHHTSLPRHVSPPPQSRKLPTRMQVFDQYIRARHRGDYSASKEQLHRFFDYAPPSGPRGTILAQRAKLHHHALINLAGFQIEMEEWEMAEMTLNEAITLARTEKDTQCLDMCHSLMKRLDAAAHIQETAGAQGTTYPGSTKLWRPAERSLQRGRLYADDLWDASRAAQRGSCALQIASEVQKLIRLSLPASLTKAQGPSSVIKPSSAIPSGDPQRTMIAQDAIRPWPTAAYLSSRVGDLPAARRHRRIARDEPYCDRSATRERDELVMGLQEAYALAEEGKYDEGLTFLLEPAHIRRMSLADYQAWTQTVFQILYLQSRRMGAWQTARRIAVLACGKEEMAEGEEGIDRHLMSHYSAGKAFVEAREGSRALEPIIRLLQDARDCSHLVMYRRGTVLLAQVLAMDFGLASAATELMEEVMPELLADHNPERRADASFTYARVILVRSAPAKQPLERSSAEEAIPWLQRAYSDLQKIADAPPGAMPVLNHLARLYHILGDLPRRDEASEDFMRIKSRSAPLQRLHGGEIRLVKTGKKLDTSSLGPKRDCLEEPSEVRDDETAAGVQLSQWEELIATVGARITAGP